VTNVKARTPEFTRPGFRWHITEVDGHLWVSIQHNAAGVGRLRCWMDGWLGSVCLHGQDEDDTAEVQEEFNELVTALYDAWTSAAADIEISQAAHELAKLDAGVLCADVLEVSHPVTPAHRRHRAARARARATGLTLATLVVAAPLGVHRVCVAVGERSAVPYVRALNALSLTATGLALRRRRR